MEKLGILAGSGRFPVLIAEEARRAGMEVVVLGISGVTDAAILDDAEDGRTPSDHFPVTATVQF